MIVCQATGGEKVVLILGLSHANLTSLRDGQSLKVSRESHGLMIPAELSIVISASPTEEDMYRALVERGLITGTAVETDPDRAHPIPEALRRRPRTKGR